MDKLTDAIPSSLREKGVPTYPENPGLFPHTKVFCPAYREFQEWAQEHLGMGMQWALKILDEAISLGSGFGPIVGACIGGDILAKDQDAKSGKLLLVLSDRFTSKRLPPLVRLFGPTLPSPDELVAEIAELRRNAELNDIQLDVLGSNEDRLIQFSLNRFGYISSTEMRRGMVLCDDVQA